MSPELDICTNCFKLLYAMKKFIITDDGFGNPGPFHAESAEALADQMLPTLELKSYEAEQRRNNFV